ncbi:MAG: integrase arm-type DNA-binding domain-containing protein [Sphingopyxis sp.]|nr:integrase arm-type DNA-binding domain-containing protein [Sphingopyxis sp.]
MSRTINKLSDRRIQSLRSPGRYSDGDGLYVRVSNSGSKSFSFRVVRGGKATEVGLGAYPLLGLAQARQRAEKLRKTAHQGADISQNNIVLPALAARTFGEVATAYINSIEAAFKNQKHREQWRMTLGPAYCASLHERPIDTISLSDVLGVVQPIWHTKAETAYRIRGRLERVLEFARVQGWRNGENPARWRGNLDAILPTTHRLRNEAHFSAIGYAELPRVFATLRQKQTIGAKALQFAILTACRTGEVIGARWDELDLGEKPVWTIPKERMKRGVAHSVPLSLQLVELLTELKGKQVCDFVFPGSSMDRPISNITMLKVLKDMGHTETVHGFRSTFTDWIAEETAFSPALADFALAHGLKSKTNAAYRRMTAVEKRRPMMQEWADYCFSWSEKGNS